MADAEQLAQLVLQEPGVAVLDAVGIVDEEHEGGRDCAGLGEIVELGPLALDQGRLVAFQGLAQKPVQLAGAHPDVALGADGLSRGQHVAQPLAGRRPRRRAPARAGRCAVPGSSPA